MQIQGEESVELLAAEVFVYADALAKRNGFFGLRNGRNSPGDLRDPNLVFPGDRLILPDGRLVNVQPGETIWKLSGEHYKKDFARLRLVIEDSQRIASHLEKKKKESRV